MRILNLHWSNNQIITPLILLLFFGMSSSGKIKYLLFRLNSNNLEHSLLETTENFKKSCCLNHGMFDILPLI